jgi:sigma-B regulation protein RsbU (phosphoserine phosphatase)
VVPLPRILVADDQTDILQALRLLLGDAGFDTDLVSSADGVLASLGRKAYDLLLMDLNYTRDTTSGREGLELLEDVRARDAALPVVVMTGWGSIDTAVEAMRRGAKSFVQKPWDDGTLLEVVRREVDDGRAARLLDVSRSRELDDALAIQRALLPTDLPSITGCTIAASWTPAAGVSGDCYDVLRFSDTRLGVSIADVIGKGVPAALLMSNLQAAVRAFATDHADPRDVCRNVNALLCRNIAIGKFVTFCYVVIDTASRKLTYANAGHNPPLVVRSNGSVERLTTTGLVLGIAADSAYATLSRRFDPGDRLLLYTDGITEARSPSDDEFGERNLLSVLHAHPHATPSELARHVLDAVRAWCAAPPQDDATLIAVSF